MSKHEKRKSISENIIFEWISENRIVCLYGLFAILIEMVAVCAVERTPFIREPYIVLGILIFLSSLVLMIKRTKVRFLVCTILLAIQAFLCLGFSVVYDMTGQYFDYGMLNLRNDAFGILEGIPMNFVTFYSALFFCIFFIIFSLRYIKQTKYAVCTKKHRRYYAAFAIVSLALTSFKIYSYNSVKIDKYEHMLYNNTKGNYSTYGITGNVVNEFAKGLIFNRMEELPDKEIKTFIYEKTSEPTKYFGVSEDNNVVVVLVESFEWFSFIRDAEYPNGLNISDEEIRELFPNITKFYDESVIVDNFHSKEKTDISETLSILGSYPTDYYINYDYYDNTIPHTMPNILRTKYGDDISINSFHNGFKTFYNRDKEHEAFGFEFLTDMYDMYDMSDKFVESGIAKEPTMHDWFSEGQRNLDSEMINTCKDEMFPVDKKFYTYITTITMHGLYYERENLKGNRKKLTKMFKPDGTDEEMDETLVNYLSAVMEFDTALGAMMEDLESKNLLDNTTIVLFGDHNCYYSELSNYVKEIDDYDTDNYYTDLYKVPLMIYDKNLEPQVVDKFTCTSDIVPTLMDLMGIKYYSNMYYGNSVFSEEESVLYSRAYGFFVGEGIVGKSLNSLYYRSPSVSKEDKKAFDEGAKKLVKKIKYCDHIFYQDYFGNDKNYKEFINNINKINQWN